MRHAALLAVHYSARLLASTASLGTRVTASAEVGALGSRGEEHRTLPGDKAFAAARHAGQDIYVSSHGSFTQSFTILVTNYFIYYASCLVSHALPSCALACGCYRPRDLTCMRGNKHEIHLGTGKPGEKVDDTEEVTLSLFKRLRRRGSGGEGDWETVVLVTAQMAGASSREGMGLHGGDGSRELAREARSGTDTPCRPYRPSRIAKGNRCNTAGCRA